MFSLVLLLSTVAVEPNVEVKKETTLVLSLDSKGQLFIGTAEKSLSSPEEIKLALEQEHADLKSNNTDVVVVLRSERDTEYKKVYDILKTCKQVGFQKIKLRVWTKKRDDRIDIPSGLIVRVKSTKDGRIDQVSVLNKLRKDAVMPKDDWDDALRKHMKKIRKEMETDDVVQTHHVTVEADPGLKFSEVMEVREVLEKAGFMEIGFSAFEVSETQITDFSYGRRLQKQIFTQGHWTPEDQ